MPVDLLLTIEAKQPNFRLWMNTSGMTSLDRPVLAESEWRLIRSPSLYALRVAYLKGDREEAAIVRVTSGMVPNLKKLSLQSTFPATGWHTFGEEFLQDTESDCPMAVSRRRSRSFLSLLNTEALR